MNVDTGVASYSRSIRRRRTGFGARSRARLVRGRRLRMPFSRTVRGAPLGRAFSAKSITTGSTRAVFVKPGRDFPLYAPPAQYAPQELHAVDIPGVGSPPTVYNMDTTGSIAHINIIAQGDSLASRTGQRLMMTGLQVRGKVAPLPGTGVAQGCLYIVYDLLPRGALPAITDIFDSSDFASFQKVDTRDRFQVLCRYNYSLSGLAATLPSPPSNVDKILRMRLQSSYAVGGGGTIASVTAGALYIVTMGDQPAVSGLGCALRFRLQFSDSG